MNQWSIPKLLQLQACGLIKPSKVESKLTTWSNNKFNISSHRSLDNLCHTSSISSLDLDKEEGKYLLAGAGDGTLYIHDVLLGGQPPILHIGKSSKHSHNSSVASVTWGQDSGLFISSGKESKTFIKNQKLGIQIQIYNQLRLDKGAFKTVKILAQ